MTNHVNVTKEISVPGQDIAGGRATSDLQYSTRLSLIFTQSFFTHLTCTSPNNLPKCQTQLLPILERSTKSSTLKQLTSLAQRLNVRRFGRSTILKNFLADVHIKTVDREGFLKEIEKDHSLKHAETADKSAPKIEGNFTLLLLF
jgi:hypothetical protein